MLEHQVSKYDSFVSLALPSLVRTQAFHMSLQTVESLGTRLGTTMVTKLCIPVCTYTCSIAIRHKGCSKSWTAQMLGGLPKYVNSLRAQQLLVCPVIHTKVHRQQHAGIPATLISWQPHSQGSSSPSTWYREDQVHLEPRNT